MNVKTNILVSVVGPTAVGKTAFALELAKYFETEIISADSRQFYREMEIGTAKPDASELAQVKHHFVDSHSIDDYYSAGKFEQDALQLLEKLFRTNKIVLTVGGSGLYLKALWEGMDDMPKVAIDCRKQLNQEFDQSGLEPLLAELKAADPEYYGAVDQSNHQRVIRALEVIRSTGQPFSVFRKGTGIPRPFRQVKIGLELDREVLYQRINDRMDLMITKGLFEEAQRLYSYRHHNALQTVGYSEIFHFMDGEYDKDEAIRLLKRNSRRYAKRQMTWFKRDPEIVWIHPDDLQEAIRMIEHTLNA